MSPVRRLAGAFAAACITLLLCSPVAFGWTFQLPSRPFPSPKPTKRLALTDRGTAVVPFDAPRPVRRLIRAANRISHRPYVYGGGHGTWKATGYDCSGSVSYALHAAGVLDTPLASGGLAAYGKPGPGRWVTIYAHGGHAFMVVAGRRFDTTAFKLAGSRWSHEPRGGSGFTVRHPPGL